MNSVEKLHVTFHELALLGPGLETLLIEEGVDAPVTIDALSYEGSAAPIASRPIAAGDYDALRFKLSITARDGLDVDVPVYTLFDPENTLYQEIETSFPLGANAFSVAAPAEDNQPYLFLHIDVQNSLGAGVINDTVTIGPRIFLSTRTFMPLEGVVTAIESNSGLFEVEDANGALFVVEPTDCTNFVSGFDSAKAGIGAQIVFANLSVGDAVSMSGVLGLDPGCDDPDQKAVRYHPRMLTAELAATGITLLQGVIQDVSVAGPDTTVEIALQRALDLGAQTPVMVGPSDVFHAVFTNTLLFTGWGEVQELTGAANRLQIGEAISVGVANFAGDGPNSWTGSALAGFLQPVRLSGMIEAVDDTHLELSMSGVKKGSGAPHPAQAYLQDAMPPVRAVDLGANVLVEVDAGTQVFVGPRSGWQLSQVLDAYYDNQLTGPAGYDGQTLGAPCGDLGQIDVDIDAGVMTAYVNHLLGGGEVWTIERLDVHLSSDATQKYVSWELGTPGCSLPLNNAWLNQPCIVTSLLHREPATLGDTFEVGWSRYAQSGAGAFGTSILNAGALVPGAVVPPGSDTAGWDDVNERVLLGIDFDGDMYPFDDFLDSCTGLEELVWVDLSQAQFFYFSVDSLTQAVDSQYLSGYADFKTKVIALQAEQGALSCGPGFHQNVGFGFSGVIDKNSVDTLVLGELIPVIRAIDGRVFNGGCVPD